MAGIVLRLQPYPHESAQQFACRRQAAADEAKDPQMCDFVESTFLTEQVESIKKVATLVRQLIRAGPGLGEYQVDQKIGE